MGGGGGGVVEYCNNILSTESAESGNDRLKRGFNHCNVSGVLGEQILGT